MRWPRPFGPFGLAGLLWLVAACAPAQPAPAQPGAALQGRWQRLDTGAQTFVADPLGSLAQDTIELRADGLLVDLILNTNTGAAFTTVTGGYSLVDAAHLRIDGKCWQGYDSHPCSQTYRFTLAGDRLTLYGDPSAPGQLDYQRLGPPAATLPPTIVPPGPSPTP